MAHGIPARLTPWTAAEGRKFAFTVGAAFLVLGGIVWWRDHLTLARVFGVLGGTLGVAGLVAPAKLEPVFRAWMKLALLISKVTTPIFMGVTYFVVISPVGVLMRAMGKDPMVRADQGGTFWVTRPEGKPRRSNLKRQF